MRAYGGAGAVGTVCSSLFLIRGSGVEFVHGDAIDFSVCDWSDGNVVFANSTCFDDALMWKLAKAATALKKGAIFITLTKRIPVSGARVGTCFLAFCQHFSCPRSLFLSDGPMKGRASSAASACAPQRTNGLISPSSDVMCFNPDQGRVVCTNLVFLFRFDGGVFFFGTPFARLRSLL